jgi:hypothetical protein
MGDTFFNGFYPVIDASTGEKINGMILAAEFFHILHREHGFTNLTLFRHSSPLSR